MATMTSKGQVTVPKDIRDALGIGPGSEIEFHLEEGRVILCRRVRKEALKRWEGYLKGKLPGETVDETMEMLRGERLHEEEQTR